MTASFLTHFIANGLACSRHSSTYFSSSVWLSWQLKLSSQACALFCPCSYSELLQYWKFFSPCGNTMHIPPSGYFFSSFFFWEYCWIFCVCMCVVSSSLYICFDVNSFRESCVTHTFSLCLNKIWVRHPSSVLLYTHSSPTQPSPHYHNCWSVYTSSLILNSEGQGLCLPCTLLYLRCLTASGT